MAATNPPMTPGADDPRLAEVETYRRELTGYCYRMLGSPFEADDAVQETMVRAWRALDGFEGRSSLRSWLYRIATNVCLDALRGRERRARPMDMGPASTADTPLGPMLEQFPWLQPVPDAWLPEPSSDPAELAISREAVRLAFVAALQHLPPKQRAVLLLREVLRWKAEEVAELLDTTVASVNSALQRGRATLDAQSDREVDRPAPAKAPPDEELLDRYVDAFERYDIGELVTVIHEDATFTMPPFELWLRGTTDIAKWYVGQGAACEGSKLIRTSANGTAAFGAYKPHPDGGRVPFALQVIESADGRIVGLHHFLGPQLFATFGLPDRLP